MSTFQPLPEIILPGGFSHIHKVLIANRGEIACRIIKTCKSLGLSSVSIYSPADRSSLHVRQADEAYLLPGPDQTAYIDEEVILDIATRSGAQAVIPGYGELLLAARSRVTSKRRPLSCQPQLTHWICSVRFGNRFLIRKRWICRTGRTSRTRLGRAVVEGDQAVWAQTYRQAISRRSRSESSYMTTTRS
jgi:hypothetical protein